MDQTQSKYQSPLVCLEPTSSQFIFGVSFSNPVNHLMLYKQHLYALYLLLYGYGEEQHRAMLIEKVEKIIRSLEKYILHRDQPAYMHLRQQDAQANISALRFLKQDLIMPKGPNSQITFHSLKVRESLRTGIKKIYQDRGQLRPFMNLFDFAKLAGSIFSLKCSIKQYYNFQLIQYNCDLFDQKNIQVFIQIDKLANTYRYIKQYHDNRLDAVCGSGIEDLTIKNVPNNISNSSFMNLIQKDIEQSQSQDQAKWIEKVDEAGQDDEDQRVEQESSQEIEESDLAEEDDVQIDSNDQLVPQWYQFDGEVEYKLQESEMEKQDEDQNQNQKKIERKQQKVEKKQKQQKYQKIDKIEKQKQQKQQNRIKLSNHSNPNKDANANTNINTNIKQSSVSIKSSNVSIKQNQKQTSSKNNNKNVQNSSITFTNSVRLSQKQISSIKLIEQKEKSKQKDKKQFMEDSIITVHHHQNQHKNEINQKQQRHKYKKIHSLNQISIQKQQQSNLTMRTQSKIISSSNHQHQHNHQHTNQYRNTRKQRQSVEPFPITDLNIHFNNNNNNNSHNNIRQYNQQRKQNTFKLQRTDSKQYKQDIVVDSETEQVNINIISENYETNNNKSNENNSSYVNSTSNNSTNNNRTNNNRTNNNSNSNSNKQIGQRITKQLSGDLLAKINCTDLVQQLSNIDQFIQIFDMVNKNAMLNFGLSLNKASSQKKQIKKDINFIVQTLQQAIANGNQQQVQLYLKRSQQIIQKYKLRKQQSQYLISYLSGGSNSSLVEPVVPLPTKTNTAITAMPLSINTLMIHSSPPASPINFVGNALMPGNKNVGTLGVLTQSLPNSYNAYILAKNTVDSSISSTINNSTNNKNPMINSNSNSINDSINNSIKNSINSNPNAKTNTNTNININSNTNTNHYSSTNSQSFSHPIPQPHSLSLNLNLSLNQSNNQTVNNSAIKQKQAAISTKNNPVDLSYKAIMKLSNKTSSTMTQSQSPQKINRSDMKNRVAHLMQRRYVPTVQPSAFSTQITTHAHTHGHAHSMRQKYPSQTSIIHTNSMISYANSANNNNNNNHNNNNSNTIFTSNNNKKSLNDSIVNNSLNNSLINNSLTINSSMNSNNNNNNNNRINNNINSNTNTNANTNANTNINSNSNGNRINTVVDGNSNSHINNINGNTNTNSNSNSNNIKQMPAIKQLPSSSSTTSIKSDSNIIRIEPLIKNNPLSSSSTSLKTYKYSSQVKIVYDHQNQNHNPNVNINANINVNLYSPLKSGIK